MNRTWNAIVTFLIVLAPVSAHSGDFYSNLGVRQHQLRISDSSFNSFAVSGHTGVWLGKGFGIELGLSLPVTEDTHGASTVDMDGLLSLGGRLEGPMSTKGMAAYFLAGFSTARINAAAVNGSSQINSSYSGPFVGFGIVKKIGRRSQLSLDFTHYSIDTAVDIPSLGIGFRRYF